MTELRQLVQQRGLKEVIRALANVCDANGEEIVVTDRYGQYNKERWRRDATKIRTFVDSIESPI